MEKGIVHTRVVSTLLIVACIILSAGLSGYFLDLYKTGTASANEPPTANAGEGPIYGYPTVDITFDGTGSSDPDGELFSYEWDFGDGYAGIGMKPVHSFDDPGTYSVELKVTDNDGAVDIDGINVIISEDTDGTGMYTLLPINEILTNGTVWYDKMVRVAYATVTDSGSYYSGYGSDPNGWVKFYVSDASTTKEIEVYCQGGADRPLDLKRGDQVNVSAMLDEYNNKWELNVRKDTLDRVTLCPAIYNPYTLGELLEDRLSHNGELIVIENLEILSEWAYGWDVTDDTTDESVSLYAEMNANVSKDVNISDLVTIQGVFTYYDYNNDGPDDNEWEIKVRNAAQDMILRTWEYDYPPAISSITRTPEEPSPYDAVTINATVTDNILVAGASLLYAFDGGTYTEVVMSQTTDNFYEAVIPAALHGTNVTYYVLASDSDGQESQSPEQYYISLDTPPEIVEMGQVPVWVRPPDTVVVWAILEDDGGIESATIVYTTDGWGNATYLPMMDNGTAPDNIANDGAFNGTLGIFAEGVEVEYYISVRDSVGNNITSENITFISSYDQPPLFKGVYRDIELPSATDSVRIITNVTDDFQLVNVTLVYNNGTVNVEVNMTKRADGNYEAAIPVHDSLTVIEYYVNATDNATHTITFPSEPSTYLVGYGAPTILYTTGHGESSGKLSDFSEVVTNNGFNWQEADINDADLDWVEFIIINNPTSNYTADEMALINDFVTNGGGLFIMSESDYDDGCNSENCNPILENLSIEGRFNDDGYQDQFYYFDYPSYDWNDDNYDAPWIPYFNFYHIGNNYTWPGDGPNDGTWVAGDYSEWNCFDSDTIGITSGFSLNKSYLKGLSMSTLVNVGSDITVIKGTDQGYNVENSGIPMTTYAPGSFPPILAAHTGAGTGRVLYGGVASMLSSDNWDGWESANNEELTVNIINWLKNDPLPLPPSIDNVQHNPLEPTSSEPVTVTADVTGTDNGTGIVPLITDVILHYSVNGSYYVPLTMSDSGGDTYSAEISKKETGAVITYYIQVIDDAGNFGYWPTIPEESGIGWYVVQGGRHIVLSEICYNPPGTDGDFEFVELYNPLPAAIDISGWQMCEISGEDNYTDWAPSIPTGSIIPAFGYFLQAKAEYEGWGADFVTSWSLGNNGDGFGAAIFLYDANENVIDKCCYDDREIGYLNSTLYEGSPFTGNPYWDDHVAPVTKDEDGSIERLPGFNDPLSGNWQDTDDNSVDFAFRKFVDAQGTASPPEYPPWAADITSPHLFPDDHPANMVLSQPAQEIVVMDEPIQQDFFGEELVEEIEPQKASSSAGTIVSLVLVVSIVLLLVPRRRED